MVCLLLLLLLILLLMRSAVPEGMPRHAVCQGSDISSVAVSVGQSDHGERYWLVFSDAWSIRSTVKDPWLVP